MTSFTEFFQLVPTWIRISACIAMAAALAWVLATRVTDEATFSINADTEVLTVEPECGQQVVWDLPEGQIGIVREDGKSTSPEKSKPISVALRGGSRARVRIDQEGRWLIDLGRSNSFGCSGAAADAVTFTANGKSKAAEGNDVFYRSSSGIRAGTGPVLLLRGRVVLGQEISFGGGAARGPDAPLLGRASIDVRTLDTHTRQRRLIHEETVDPGGMIDTHACLDEPHDSSAAVFDCVRNARSSGEGFFRTVKRDDGAALEVQLAVTGRNVGVRQQGGSERRLLITWWSRFVTSSFVQLFAAILIFLSAFLQLLVSLKRDGMGEKNERSHG